MKKHQSQFFQSGFAVIDKELFKRSAHSAVPTLVAWRFGGNEGLEGLERNRDWWSWTGKNAANLKQTLEQSYRELAHVLLEFWCIWIKIIEKSVLEGVWGVRSHRKCYQDQALHQKLRIGESQDYPKEAESCPQIDPREAKGKQISPFTVILRGKSIQNHWEIAQNWCQQAENVKSVKSAKSLKKQWFFNGFHWFLVFTSMANRKKHGIFGY